MNTKKNIIQILHKLKDQLKKQFKIKDLWAFGSFVRGEQTETSDVDILVDFEEGADLFDQIGLVLFLEERLGHKVDIVSKRALRGELKEIILKEAVAV